MLSSFRSLLAFSALILGTCGAAYAQDGNAESKIHMNYRRIPLLTKQQMMDGFSDGLNKGATHMLIVWDKWDFENSYDFIVYCYPEEDVNELIKFHTVPGYYSVSMVFAMHLDIDQQFSDKRWYPEYP